MNHEGVTVHGVADPTLAPLVAAADALDEAVLIVDAAQVVTHANAAAERLLDDGPLANRSAADVLGAGIQELLRNPTTATGPVLRPLPTAEVLAAECAAPFVQCLVTDRRSLGRLEQE